MPNVDAEKLRLEQALANGLEPRLRRIDIEAINSGADHYVLVIRVGPHLVKAINCFYSLSSAGRCPLDVGALRTAFVAQEHQFCCCRAAVQFCTSCPPRRLQAWPIGRRSAERAAKSGAGQGAAMAEVAISAAVPGL